MKCFLPQIWNIGFLKKISVNIKFTNEKSRNVYQDFNMLSKKKDLKKNIYLIYFCKYKVYQ